MLYVHVVCVCAVHAHVVLKRILKRQDEEIRRVEGVALGGTTRKGSINRYGWVWGHGSAVKACFITSGFVSSHLGQSLNQGVKADGSIGLRLAWGCGAESSIHSIVKPPSLSGSPRERPWLQSSAPPKQKTKESEIRAECNKDFDEERKSEGGSNGREAQKPPRLPNLQVCEFLAQPILNRNMDTSEDRDSEEGVWAVEGDRGRLWNAWNKSRCQLSHEEPKAET